MTGDGNPEVPLHSMQTLFERQKHAFFQHAPLSLNKRREALNNLLQSIVNHQDDLIQAVSADFGNRAVAETRLLELFPLMDEIRHAKRHLRRWMKRRSVRANWQFLPSRAKIIYQPLGVVGVIGAWNYPILLILSPLANALAAGNHVIIKPSEQAPLTAEVIRRIIGEAFPEEYVAVVIGDKEVASAFCTLPFDHLLFTGSTNVGKLVMRSAAENLTPVTLELGGKSPALVHESYSMATAADRICTTKFWNAGQTCIAPDYVLVPVHKKDEFVSACEVTIAKRFANSSASPDYSHMINASAWNRMRALVDDAASKGARIIQTDSLNENATNRPFLPTLILDANDSMHLMQTEIFGPILPVLTYSSMDEALSYINARPRPLALYYFDNNDSRTSKVLEQTTSGGACINECIFHFAQHKLPFGGIGPSGMGAYHGFEGFKTFSKKKGVFLQSAIVGSVLDRFLKPPYTPASHRVINLLMGRNATRPVQKLQLPE